ncbi:E3 ubiquitin-protein ligase listerin [Rhynchospora pubera]|uniref:E3 ubiquitin-protein ligase listerin n=1 Tax=Rhynchospora pubera TaxID=906938 RepID=A0AAV8E0F1_9POAL|nr:E3 ubiquitin-protein ligase listerin [Rhynchospora pubera]
MGKQKGDASRSKNRASSSSMASSLVPTGAPTVGFGGYLGSSKVEASVASTSAEEAATFTDVDNEMRQHVKRLGRKDPTTKLKALAALTQLFKEKPAEEIAQIIPLWAFEYKRLLLDYNREVRRATHETMSALVTSVRRGLASHLKSLMGPWWFSQFDPAPEVSQAARLSFEAAFPQSEKRLDALMLCGKDIFLYLDENLNLTPQALSDKAIPTDELEHMHQRIISSSLLAMATLIDILLGVKLQRNHENLSDEEPKGLSKVKTSTILSAETLFTSHKSFLDFFKSKAPAIRSATYTLMTSYIKHIPDVLNDGTMKMVSPAILCSFQEKNTVCHSSMWEMVILFSKKFPEGWSSCNVEKVVFPRLWSLLRNSCYGSQEISYPALVKFLDSIPVQVFNGEKFVLDFLRNLWAGRNPIRSTTQERSVFFSSYKQCLLSVLHNVSRFCTEGASSNLPKKILDEILLKLLLHDYLLLGDTMKPERSSKALDDYLKNLGKSIIEILSELFDLVDQELFNAFCSSFKRDCMGIIQDAENYEQFNLCMEQICKFFVLLDEHVLREGKSWPLDSLARPLVKDAFSVIRSSNNASHVSLLSTLSETFAPVELFSELSDKASDSVEQEKLKVFVQTFKDELVPWCLDRNTLSSGAKVDFLISLMQDECFSEQWASIFIFLTDGQSAVQIDQLEVLALLLEKIRVNIGKLKRKGSLPDHWHHNLLDSTAVAVATGPSTEALGTRFLCAALGGSSKADQTCFISKEALKNVIDGFLTKLVYPLAISHLNFAQFSSSQLISSSNAKYQAGNVPKSSCEAAYFAFEVIRRSVYCFTSLPEEKILIASVLAALFSHSWEYSVNRANSHIESPTGLNLGKMVFDFLKGVETGFWSDLDPSVRAATGTILVKVIRFAVFNPTQPITEEMLEWYTQWVIDLTSTVCQSDGELQGLLDQLISEEKSCSWPIWVGLDKQGKSRSCFVIADQATMENIPTSHSNFVAFIDKLISCLGFSKVIGGDIPESPTSSLSREWLATEILCTWKWQGGSAQHLFLPSLVEYTKGQTFFLSSIAKILLEGAVLHGSGFNTSSWILFNSWFSSDQEINKIQEPFLRALVTVLLVLSAKGNIHRESDASAFFEHVKDMLTDATSINRACLRALPYAMSAIIQPLCEKLQSDHGNVNVIDGYILGWLQTCIPYLSDQSSKEDFEDWIQVVLSCYPLIIVEGNGTFRIKNGREVSHEEKSLLVSLFRKYQRSGSGIVSSDMMQLIESKLTAVMVAYCWLEIEENDWRVVFNRVNKWTQSCVLLMEETTEIVDSSGTDLENLKTIVRNLDRVAIETASVALTIHCVIYEINEAQEKWEMEMKSRMMENILRLFLTTGSMESIAKSLSEEASEIVASSRFSYLQFWGLVASIVNNSTVEVRKSAVEAMDLWGLSKGSVDALYALLFSSQPVHYLQLAAYNLLASEPVCQVSIVKEGANHSDLDGALCLRDEICTLIQIPTDQLLEMDLLEQKRVNVFNAWGLLLTHLAYLPASAPTREKVIQFIQDNINPDILLCLFQHIPLNVGSSPKRKDKDASDLLPEASNAANASKLAIVNCSISLFVESLWPMGTEQMASFAGGLYGMMVRLLPSYVRGWFTSLRDRSLSMAIETYTKTWCSPPLVSDELSQVKDSVIVDENFSVSVSRSANEIVATYKKEETGMDLVIRLPASYPLRHADVECARSLGISEVKQRKWLLSLTAFIRNQNGAIAEAIRIWKTNFDKEFEGVEECPICYSILHTTNHSLPRLACKTCKHKFHSACLYKWFSTSHKSTCPLCQTPF